MPRTPCAKPLDSTTTRAGAAFVYYFGQAANVKHVDSFAHEDDRDDVPVNMWP